MFAGILPASSTTAIDDRVKRLCAQRAGNGRWVYVIVVPIVRTVPGRRRGTEVFAR